MPHLPRKTTWAHLLTRRERHVFVASPIDTPTLVLTTVVRKRFRTVADTKSRVTRTPRQPLDPQNVKREPFATHSGKHKKTWTQEEHGGTHMLAAAVSKSSIHWCASQTESHTVGYTIGNRTKRPATLQFYCKRMQKQLQVHKETQPADQLAFGLSEAFSRKAMKGVTWVHWSGRSACIRVIACNWPLRVHWVNLVNLSQFETLRHGQCSALGASLPLLLPFLLSLGRPHKHNDGQFLISQGLVLDQSWQPMEQYEKNIYIYIILYYNYNIRNMMWYEYIIFIIFSLSSYPYISYIKYNIYIYTYIYVYIYTYIYIYMYIYIHIYIYIIHIYIYIYSRPE